MQISVDPWRRSHEATRYPFEASAALVSRTGRPLLEGTFVDARLYPVGGGDRLYLASITVDRSSATVVVGDSANAALASGTFALASPPASLALTDRQGRPAGLLVSTAVQLGLLAAFGPGEHPFTAEAATFVPGVCVPTPEPGFRGFVLDDGEILSGDIWLVGDDGVVLRVYARDLPATPVRPATHAQIVEVNVVGDPLFRRRLCQGLALLDSPQFIRTVRIVGPNMSFDAQPDDRGDLPVVAGNSLAADSILRVIPTDRGFRISTVGSSPTE